MRWGLSCLTNYGGMGWDRGAGGGGSPAAVSSCTILPEIHSLKIQSVTKCVEQNVCPA